MWRIVLGASLLLTLALGSAAAACPSCGAKTAVESVRIEDGTSSQILTLTVRPLSASFDMPEKATAVVMFFNGNRAKCLNSPIFRSSVDTSGLYTYKGQIPAYFGGTDRAAVTTYTGRLEVAGDVYEFTASTDGKPGTVKTVTDGTTVNNVAVTAAPTAVTVVTPVPLPTTATSIATAAAEAAPQPAGADSWAPLRQPIAWLAAIAVIATLAGAFIDRRRALARATA